MTAIDWERSDEANANHNPQTFTVVHEPPAWRDDDRFTERLSHDVWMHVYPDGAEAECASTRCTWRDAHADPEQLRRIAEDHAPDAWVNVVTHPGPSASEHCQLCDRTGSVMAKNCKARSPIHECWFPCVCAGGPVEPSCPGHRGLA